jgi:hypothetical protein
MNEISTDAWTLMVPTDWIQTDPTDHGSLSYESRDGSKGLYISTWDIGPDSGRPGDVAESFTAQDKLALLAIEGCTWSVVGEQLSEDDGTAIALLDNLAVASSYRIVTKILARPPLVVRAAFHDYLCEDYTVSSEYFAPIIESLRLRS